MAFLSIDRDGMMVGCANPIYLTSDPDYRTGAKITFEVLESDAGFLKRLVGKVETFGFDPKVSPFRAEVTSLEPCTSTVLALSLMRHKPAMRGVLTVQPTEEPK
jgi:predicted transcriptional regulator